MVQGVDKRNDGKVTGQSRKFEYAKERKKKHTRETRIRVPYKREEGRKPEPSPGLIRPFLKSHKTPSVKRNMTTKNAKFIPRPNTAEATN